MLPPAASRTGSLTIYDRGLEDVLEVEAALFEADKPEVEVDNGIADLVVNAVCVSVHGDQQHPAVTRHRQPLPAQMRGQSVHVAVDLNDQQARGSRKGRHRHRPDKPAAGDLDKMLADALDLAQEVRR